MSWISDRAPPLEPMWRALITVIASLSGSWLVVHFWMISRGAERMAMLLIGPFYYVIVFMIVATILSVVLPRIETPGPRAAIIAGFFFVMGIIRRELPLWEFLLAAILALLQYLELVRRAADERDLRDLL